MAGDPVPNPEVGPTKSSNRGEPTITKRVKVPPTRSQEPQKADHTEAGQEVRRTWAQRILDAWRALTQRRGH